MSKAHSPARKPREPKYRHYKPKGLAVVRIDGHDLYLGKYDSPESWENYYRLLTDWRLNATPPATLEPAQSPDLSVNELLLAFLDHAEQYYRRPDGTPAPEFENLKLAMRPVRQLFGSTIATAFGPKALKSIRQRMIDSGLCRRTINQRIARVVRIFKFGVENEFIPPSVHQALTAVPGLAADRSTAREGRKVGTVPDAHVDAVRPHLSRQLWAVIELQRLTGMRSGEALAMKSGEIDMTGSIWVYTPARHKTSSRGKDRRIFLGPRAQEVIRPWLRPDPREHLFSPKEAMEDFNESRRRARKTPMTPSQRARTRKSFRKKKPGEVYDTRAFNHAVRRACERAGVPRWHPHQLRHNAATRLRSELGLEVARAVLGHTSSAVTEIYAEIDSAAASEAMERMG